MNDYDLELIKKELKQNEDKYKIKFKPIKLTKSIIDNLFNKFNACSYCIKWYDSEPDNEEYNKLTNIGMEKRSREQIYRINQLIQEYNNERKEFNNWVDVYEEGIWYYTFYEIKKLSKGMLNSIKIDTYNLNRLYMLNSKEFCKLYFYSRDLEDQNDIWFTFYNEDVNNPCLYCKKQNCYIECKKSKLYKK